MLSCAAVGEASLICTDHRDLSIHILSQMNPKTRTALSSPISAPTIRARVSWTRTTCPVPTGATSSRRRRSKRGSCTRRSRDRTSNRCHRPRGRRLGRRSWRTTRGRRSCPPSLRSWTSRSPTSSRFGRSTHRRSRPPPSSWGARSATSASKATPSNGLFFS